MDVKRVAVAGVIVERRRKLEVNNVREFKSRAHLPSQQESVVVWGELSLPGCRLRCSWPRADWIFRILIVVNELTEVCEKVELQEWLGWRPGYNGFAILAE